MNLHEQLGAYLDGELNAEERAAIEAALATDGALRSALNALKRLSNELRVDDTDRAVAQRIGVRLRRRRLQRALWPALPLAASLLLAVVLLRPAPGPILTGDDLLNQYTDAVAFVTDPPDGLQQ